MAANLTKRDQPKKFADGYSYVRDKAGPHGVVYWCCAKRMSDFEQASIAAFSRSFPNGRAATFIICARVCTGG